MTQLTDLIAKQRQSYQEALITATAALDQTATDLAALQERQKAEQEAIQREATALQRAQQAAYLQKNRCQEALAALDELVDKAPEK